MKGLLTMAANDDPTRDDSRLPPSLRMTHADELARRRQALLLRSEALRVRLAIDRGALSASVRSPFAMTAGRLMPLLTMLATGMRIARLFKRRSARR